MSVATNALLGAQLAGSTALKALVGVDPDLQGNQPAIYQARTGELFEPPVYPCVVYRGQENNPIDQIAWGYGGGAADLELYGVEIWVNDRGSDTAEQIFETLDPLLQFWRPTDPDGHNHYWEVLRLPGGSTGLYHEQLKAWQSVYRYALRHRRY